MRKLLALCVLLLGVSWATAQNSTPKSSTSAGGGTKTVEGCLSSTGGQYTLTDQQGKTFQLSGDTSKLAEHVGHEVKITGTESSGSASSTATGAGETGMMLEVSSIKHVSKTCKNATGGSMSH